MVVKTRDFRIALTTFTAAINVTISSRQTIKRLLGVIHFTKNQQTTIMRNLFFSVLVLLLSVTTLTAQSGEDAYKSARKAIDSYSLSQDATKLTEAVDMIEKAMADADVAANPKALVEAGDIYAAAINSYVNARLLNVSDAKNTPKLTENAAVKAANAYMKAYKTSDPKKGKSVRKAVMKNAPALQGNISNEGIYAIQDKEFDKSFEAFKTSVMFHDFIVENGGDSSLDDAKLNDEKYYAGLSAILTEKYDEAEPLYVALHEAKYDEATLYDGLYKIFDSKGDKETAYKYLQEGRAAYPDENSLLFTEINYYLAEGKLDALTGKLDEAISKEPENISLYATLGQVYERLYNSSKEAGETEKAAEYFAKAQGKYEEGLKKDPEAGRLIYSLGAMIYNRGAAMSQQLVEMESDFSKEGQKKYETLKTKVDAEFEKALPYFQKAEMATPGDINTLIALKEMYARKSEYDVSNEFKARIEKLQNKEEIKTSYFKEKGM